jgi:rhodanese-related sulfurtransferase
MKQHGFDNVAALLGGMQAWQNAGLPVETGQ